MVYNNQKSEIERDKTTEEEEKQGLHSSAEQVNTCGDADKPSSSLSSSKLHADDGQNHNVPLGRNNASRQSRVRKLAHKKEVEAILILAFTRRKQKQGTATKEFSHICDTCGENFKSRNKLHRHLDDTMLHLKIEEHCITFKKNTEIVWESQIRNPWIVWHSILFLSFVICRKLTYKYLNITWYIFFSLL